MPVTDIMAPSEGISPKWTQFPSEKRWKLNILKKNMLKISKIVQLSGVKCAIIRCFYIAKKRFGCRHPEKRAIIQIVQLSRVQLSGYYCIGFLRKSFTERGV